MKHYPGYENNYTNLFFIRNVDRYNYSLKFDSQTKIKQWRDAPFNCIVQIIISLLHGPKPIPSSLWNRSLPQKKKQHYITWPQLLPMIILSVLHSNTSLLPHFPLVDLTLIKELLTPLIGGMNSVHILPSLHLLSWLLKPFPFKYLCFLSLSGHQVCFYPQHIYSRKYSSNHLPKGYFNHFHGKSPSFHPWITSKSCLNVPQYHLLLH